MRSSVHRKNENPFVIILGLKGPNEKTFETVEKQATSEADGKCPDARLPKSRGMKRT